MADGAIKLWLKIMQIGFATVTAHSRIMFTDPCRKFIYPPVDGGPIPIVSGLDSGVSYQRVTLVMTDVVPECTTLVLHWDCPSYPVTYWNVMEVR